MVSFMYSGRLNTPVPKCLEALFPSSPMVFVGAVKQKTGEKHRAEN